MEHLVTALAVHRIEFLRPTEKLRLFDLVRSGFRFDQLTLDEVGRCVGRQLDRVRTFDPNRLLRYAERDADYLSRKPVAVSFIFDRGYPALLREIFDPPFALFVRGSLPEASPEADDGSQLPSDPWSVAPKMVAIVGTRRPTSDARRAATALAEEFAASDVTVVSGLAFGIDSAAHAGAVRIGGPTVAVFGCGIDQVYPRTNLRLAERILETGGALCSEYGPGVPPIGYHFPGRNRIISGLSQAVVVVEAPARSGALFTAEYALDYGRDLFVHSVGVCAESDAGRDDDSMQSDRRRADRCAGTSALAADGAVVVSTADEVLREWGVSPEPKRYGRRRSETLPLFPDGETGPGIGRALAARLRNELRR